MPLPSCEGRERSGPRCCRGRGGATERGSSPRRYREAGGGGGKTPLPGPAGVGGPAGGGAMEPTASRVFCGRVLGMVNAEDVNAIIQAQKNM